tara:strand:+ start:8795 stop:9880 length:1086 start_codon:yes stop_codon:yes gene_type:complete
MNIIFIILFVLIIVSLILFFSINKNERNFFREIYEYNFNQSYYSKSNFKKPNNLTFIPHPIYNWSLNPFHKNSNNQFSHTIEGFRKTSNANSIMDNLDYSFKVICIGGSTTHCQEIDDVSKTWPSLLNSKLNNQNSFVYNFGVGGWNTLQSLNRLISWSNIIKPNLIILYQSKNDLTPFVQGNFKEKTIQNDLQNIIVQFSQSFNFGYLRLFSKIPIINIIIYKLFLRRKFLKFGLLNIYKPKAESNTNGLKRINNENIENILLRIETIFKIAEILDSKVLYVPELVFDKEYSTVLREKIFPKIKKISEKYQNVEYFDLYNVMQFNSEYFIDKMHFTESGCEIFSEILKTKIINDYYKLND